MRDLRRRFRRDDDSDHGHAPEAGVTIAGDSVLTADAQEHAGMPDVLHPEIVRTEGAVSTASGGAFLETVTVWLFQPEQEPRQVDPRALPQLIKVEPNFVWVDLSSYGERDLREVGRLLGLHRRAIHATLSPWQRPRLSVYGDHFFTSATVARLEDTYRVCAGELDLFVGHNYLVSAHKRPLPFADHLLTRARTSPELIALDADFMLYVILDEVLAYHEELERHMQGEIERMEERALRDTSDAFLEDLLRFKRYAFALYQLVDGHRPVFAAFLRPDFHWGSGEEIEEYVEDLHERLLRLLATLSQARDVVNGAFEIYVSQMSHRTNQVIKVLTIVSTVLFSASIIVSVFGITVATTIHRSPVGTPVGFLIMLICVLAVCGGALYLFRRRGWI